MAFPIILTGGQVTVNVGDEAPNVNLIGPAWGTHDEGFTQLLLPPDMVGSDFDLPGEGTVPGLRMPVASTRQVPLFIVSECNHEGVPFATNGARSNLAYLRTHVIAPPDIEDRPDGTRHTRLTWDGVTYAADCRFGVRISQPTASGWFLVLDVWIRQGEFTLLGEDFEDES